MSARTNLPRKCNSTTCYIWSNLEIKRQHLRAPFVPHGVPGRIYGAVGSLRRYGAGVSAVQGGHRVRGRVVRGVQGVSSRQVQGLAERVAVPAVRSGHVQQRGGLQDARRLQGVSRQGYDERAERPGQRVCVRVCSAVLPCGIRVRDLPQGRRVPQRLHVCAAARALDPMWRRQQHCRELDCERRLGAV